MVSVDFLNIKPKKNLFDFDHELIEDEDEALSLNSEYKKMPPQVFTTKKTIKKHSINNFTKQKNMNFINGLQKHM